LIAYASGACAARPRLPVWSEPAVSRTSRATACGCDAACQAGIPSTIWKPAVVPLATKSSGVVSGLASNTSVTTVVIAGAVGKQYGVTVLEGKRHDREVNDY
jgi:hypothetical protein